MALEAYRRKRRFGTTSEPRGSVKKSSGHDGGSYVVQKHDARRLHYDFRLEMDGVLKSWAVTRGPSLVPGEKRLAVHVEDHPLEYGDFEGTIPKGEYGGGTVILWDRGRWTPLGDPHKGYAKGHLDFELTGEKLGGRWHLVRMAGRQREKRENWLLIKGDDEAARDAGAPDILEERPESVKTGRVVAEVAGERPGWSSKTGRITPSKEEDRRPERAPDASKVKKAKKAALPSFVEPTLATLVDKPASGTRFIHEIKFDGYRLQVRIEGGDIRLLTRSGLDWSAKFGKALGDSFKALPLRKALIDGELIVENENGASDFSALQADLSEGRHDRFVFYAFDLLHLDGYDLRAAPLIERKQMLVSLLAGESGMLRLSDHFEGEGDVILEHVCRLGLEGIVSKVRDAPYRSGRSKDWLKAKCSSRQEFIICGYVPSTTSRSAIGSLVLGYYSGGKLIHAGRVGTGFTRPVAEDLFRRLERIRIASSPFAERLSADAARQVRYAKPELVAEIEFRGWTADRNLRHSAFRGLREDKPAKDVVQEAVLRESMRKAPSEKASSKDAKAGTPTRQSNVKLTHPDRLYWPDTGVTKEGLADYYTQIWRRIEPFVTRRPLALVRCPGGVTGECFFQKHAWKGLNRAIHLARDPQDSSGEPILSIDDLDGLISLVQGAVLEIHPWGSTLDRIEEPDMIIMDLDPGETVSWAQVGEAASEVRDRLAQLGLASFVKTSGGKGLHVVSPLRPKADWDVVKAFCKNIADQMTADSPDRFLATITKSKRRGKVLVDYLRNGRGATAVAAYSTRARAGAPVSMPLAWDEIGSVSGAAYFTVGNAVTRLASLRSDPWEDFRRQAVPLPTAKRGKKRTV